MSDSGKPFACTFTGCNMVSLSKDLQNTSLGEHLNTACFTFNNGQTIKVNKLCLINKSPVLKAMIESSNDQIIKIHDVDQNIFKHISEYLHSGKIMFISEDLINVIIASKKYALKELTNYCVQEILKMATIENATDTLIVASIQNLEVLKHALMDFLIKNKKEYVKTSGYINLAENYTELLVEMIKRDWQC